MDIQPVNPGHVLVIPRVHAAYLSELDKEIGAHLFRVAMQVGEALRRSGVRCEGVNLFLADGEAAGQELFHVHLHVSPRFADDGFGLRHGPNNFLMASRSSLEAIAQQIKGAMPE